MIMSYFYLNHKIIARVLIITITIQAFVPNSKL